MAFGRVMVKNEWSTYWLWRAIDQDGYELDVLGQPRRSAKAALRFFKKILKGLQVCAKNDDYR